MNPHMPFKLTMIRLTLEATTETKLWTTMMMSKTTRFLRMLLWMMSLFSRQLNWIQLLFLLARGTMILTLKCAHSWCKQMYKLSFSSEKEKGKGKGKGRSKGRYPVCPSHLSLEDRRRRFTELKAKTECRACGRKGNWPHDRECAMSPSSSSSQNQTRTPRMTTQQHLSNQASKAGVCFVLNDHSDDPDTSAYVVGRNVPSPTESAKQTPLTPTTSAAVDIKKGGIFGFVPWMTMMSHG